MPVVISVYIQQVSSLSSLMTTGGYGTQYIQPSMSLCVPLKVNKKEPHQLHQSAWESVTSAGVWGLGAWEKCHHADVYFSSTPIR